MFKRPVAYLVVACCLPAAMLCASDVVELIPRDALGYVVVQHLSKTDDKFQALGQRMNLPIPGLLTMAKAQTGIAKGLDEDGSLALAFLPASQGPGGVLYVSVSDYAAFLNQLQPEGIEDNITTGKLMGRPVVVANKGSYALIARTHNRALLEKILSAEPADGGESAFGAQFTNEHEVAAVVSSAGLDMLSSLALTGLEQAKAAVREKVDEAEAAIAGIDMYVQMLKAVREEVARLAVGLKLEDAGSLRVNKWVWFQPEGKVAPLLRDVKPQEGDLLADLPSVPYVVTVGAVLPEGATEAMMDFSAQMMKATPQVYGLEPEQVDKMIELSRKYFADFRGMSFVLGVGEEGTPLYSEMLAAIHVPDAHAWMARYRQYWKELDEKLGDTAKSFLADAKLEDMKLDGVSVLKVAMPIPALQGAKLPDGNKLEELMKKFYGESGVTVYVAPADDDTVLMSYTGTNLLRKALSTTNEAGALSEEPGIVRTAKQLPAGALLVGYWNPRGTMAFVNRMMHIVADSEKAVRLPAFPDAPPVGWAINTMPSVMKATAVVPAETLQAVGQFVEQAKQAKQAAEEN